jgi:hypothetical protein
MGAASVIAIIGFGGTVFMLWVLIALLREETLTFHPLTLAAREPADSKERPQRLLSVPFDDTYAWKMGRNCNDDRVELLENQNHEMGEYDSGLTALDVCIISGKFGRRPVHTRRSSIRWERGLWFG